MTHVRVRDGPNGYALTSVGHAGTEAACVGVSALVQALAGWAMNNDASSFMSLDKGEALIAFHPCEGSNAVMELIAIGLLQIEKAAPEAVKVEIIHEE
ncbi:MAG: ribosomal-processing cysteine protease Prp [Oscillospiraceae bacterium]|nr:ribosomal-processing cysteine protease Prp [Oscillospiraceae bacterium]